VKSRREQYIEELCRHKQSQKQVQASAKARYLEMQRKRFIWKIWRMALLLLITIPVLIVIGYPHLILLPVFYAAWRLWETPNYMGDRQ
jgi:uncharacterized integral membrane protein